MADDNEECECPPCPAGIPAWVMTFADLMSLLMCFFVLLLSFSEMDIKKYKQIAGSMASAFGVQNIIKQKDIPKGTSVIQQEFSPGRPEPTPLNIVQQHTTDITKQELEASAEQFEAADGVQNEKFQELIEIMQELQDELDQEAMKLANSLQEEIDKGNIEVETKGRKIVIRVQEKGSFPSGSAELQLDFIPVMAKIANVLSQHTGSISVEGHTDSIPIDTEEFPSNWALASARAVSVAHELMADSRMDQSRFQIKGLADTRPLVDNETPSNRAKNRRVEIVIKQGEDKELKDGLNELKAEDKDLFEKLQEKEPDFFLTPDEIF
ncbi:flagellar motor protein MotB [Spartinivicinus poritis]|uniref:Flagellar motor protein MotB n=1 Tax=Spartinivicinus poritis TaxID=2994640 RepID=A0ABT5U625_9GAMM|nr:flagellar motor protein MotB [Spartinivicinus sp. A2-2]MDE1461816.1 flagellar motor protein MotB [Spartinivicinus sp. A2-2]